MIPAARESFAVQRAARAWKNPYATDGLVGMWDAEWNAGGGVHDASSVGMMNLAEDWGRVTLSSTNWSIGDKWLETLAGSQNIVINYPSKSWYESLMAGNGYTLEIYCDYPDKAMPVMFTAQGNGFSVYSVSGTNVMFQFDCQNNFQGRGSSPSGGSGYWRINPFSASKTYMAIAVTLGASYIRRVNASSNTVSGGGITGTQYYANGRNRITVGMSPQNSTGVLPSGWRMYAMRLYNRALSGSELSAHYALDKERFGQ